MSAPERREQKVCDTEIAKILSSDNEDERVNIPLAEIVEEEEVQIAEEEEEAEIEIQVAAEEEEENHRKRC